MPVRGIFLKIYLCFWLATLLVMAAHISLDWLTRSGPLGGGPFNEDHLKRTVAPVLAFYGHSALEYRKSGDYTALARSAHRFKSLSGIDAYLITSDGIVSGDRPLPEDVSDIARRARHTGKTVISSSRERALMALPITGEDGRNYYVVGNIPKKVFGPPPPPPPGPHPNGERGGTKPPPLVFGPRLLPPPGPPFSLLRLFITLIISAGACYLLARYLTSPIVRLRDATRRFAEGELSVRIGKSKVMWKDELSELADDFDNMAQRIESLMTRQRQLIQDISHELRSPLARLAVAVELVRRQGGSVAAETLDRIERESMVLNEMIGQVLEITRFENSMAEAIQKKPVDLAALLEEIVDDANFEAVIRNRSVRFTESLSCTIDGSEQWLRRGIENVVRNAIRYTHDGTTVDVHLKKDVVGSVEYAVISVHDHGDGVPEKDLPNLFLPFYRVSTARDRKTGGSGLGLAITRSAAELHNGSVAASNAPGGGLTVVIRLPLDAGSH